MSQKELADAERRTEYVEEKIEVALDSYDLEADFNGAAVIGSGEDAFVTATIEFDPQTTAEEIMNVRRGLPVTLNKKVVFGGPGTLLLKVTSEI